MSQFAPILAVVRDIFIENPMHEESLRAQRRFLRIGRSGSKVLSQVVIGLIAVFYVWFLIAVAIGKDDPSEPLLYFVLVLMCLVVPGSSYAAISGEREKATWDALILTRLTPAQIIVGKLMGRVRLIGIIGLLAIVPMMIGQSHARPEDGLSPPLLIEGFVLVLSYSLLLLSFGLFVSSTTNRSITSIAVIAGTLLAGLVFLPILVGLFDSSAFSFRHLSYDPVAWILQLNPFPGLIYTLHPDGFGINDYGSIYWAGRWGKVCIAVYLIGTVAAIWATRMRLRQLEESGRR